MKCDTVQRVIVEYTEGGLCVADELCVDIHLVQCPHCREELTELGLFQGMFSLGLTHPEPENHLRDLLIHLDCAGTSSSSSASQGTRQRFPRSTTFRFSMAVGLSALALLGGALGWGHGSLSYFQLPIVEAETGLPVPEAWRPLMRRNNALGDGDSIDAILLQSGSGIIR